MMDYIERTKMPELRQDLTTREWVIIAPERSKRPNREAKKTSIEELPDWDISCPFCIGNESRTPPEVFRIPTSNNHSAWAVRVVPNQFPALTPSAVTNRVGERRFFRRMAGFGAHEVIIESPSHNKPMALMSQQQVGRVLIAYRQRYNALKQERRLKFITIFKNHGGASGTSLVHPHSQIVATPIITPYYHRRFNVAHDYYVNLGRCLYCDLVARELGRGERIIISNKEFVAFHPYASRAPYETWIVSKRHYSSFGLFPEGHLSELAAVLKTTLLGLYRGIDDPAFNLIVDTTSTVDEDDPYYHWHIRIIPRMALIAGFEMGSGIYISTALPEDTASHMRQIVKSCV